MQKLNIAVAGAGLIGRRHIELVDANPECELIGIVDPSPSAQELSILYDTGLFGSLEELFSTQNVDGVVLATPNQLHVEHALFCIRAGCAALIEKPIAHTVDEGLRLYKAAQQSDAKLLVGHHRAHSSILRKAREIVTQGLIGDPVAVMGSALFYKPDDYFDTAPWRREAGGGPVLINMIHEIGNLRSLFGEITAVQSMASSRIRKFPVEDTAVINLQFSNGALGTFLLSDTAGSARSWEQTSQENKSYPTYPDEDCYLLAGTYGSLAVPTMRIKRYPSKSSRSWWIPFECSVADLRREDPLANQLKHFCDVVRGSAVPLVSVRDGIQNLRVVEAIAESCRTNTTSRVEVI